MQFFIVLVIKILSDAVIFFTCSRPQIDGHSRWCVKLTSVTNRTSDLFFSSYPWSLLRFILVYWPLPSSFFRSQRAFNKHEAERMYGKLVAFYDSSISIMASKKINLNLEIVCNKYNLALSRKQMAYDIVIVILQLNSIKTNTLYISWIFQESLNFHKSCYLNFLVNDLF